jgi:hypothetical protein
LKSSCSVHGPFRTSSDCTIVFFSTKAKFFKLKIFLLFYLCLILLMESMWVVVVFIYVVATVLNICFLYNFFFIISDFAYQPYKWFRMLIQSIAMRKFLKTMTSIYIYIALHYMEIYIIRVVDQLSM